MSLTDDVTDLLWRTRKVYPEAARHWARLDEPLRIAVTGPPKAGKRTLRVALADIHLVTGEPDAVIHLFRCGHYRRTVREQPAVLVLARADEITGGRLDAMTSARQVARVYPETVIPVAALLASTANTMREADFATLTALAGMPRVEVDARLMSADRVADHGLVERFGMFGLRLAVTLLRQGFDTPEKLAGELSRRSGIDDLREQIRIQFQSRTRLLKARSALNALEHLGPLRAEVERLRAGAHEFAEIRVLDSLREGRIAMPAELAAQAQRLLGGHGAAVTSRLGLGDAADPRQAALAALVRWRRLAENPLSNRQCVAAARVVVRTCEGLLTEIA
ncbi:hypothetical protein [Actinocrispum wychmicini]|uniref:Uncharacterized protein n=1 Tax=Actinocrispum wychmicini TaxID=1213861 RepID=A0A4R2IJ25_9PSEU|nr:hypothetical protein [Actinocrispum wychmicini]TCO44216.1 hypothetical protein EV192_12539 [Actinocrispum wychmicini]